MDLKDFIKQTISSIHKAISESQTELKDKGVIINPEKTEIGNGGGKALHSNGSRFVQNLDFDILVGVDDKQSTGGKGELKVVGLFNLGAGVNDENITVNHNRIRFTIPVAFSSMKTPSNYKPEPPSLTS